MGLVKFGCGSINYCAGCGASTDDGSCDCVNSYNSTREIQAKRAGNFKPSAMEKDDKFTDSSKSRAEKETTPEAIPIEKRQHAALKMLISNVCEKAMCMSMTYEDVIAEFERAWWHENRKFGR